LKDVNLKKSSTSAADHLFEVNPKHIKLGDNKRKKFHTTAATA